MLSSGTFRPVFIYEAVASHCCQLIISSFPSFSEYKPKMMAQTKLNLRKAQITYNKCVFHFSWFERMMRGLLAKWFQASTLQFVLKEAVKKTNTSLLETPFWSGDFIYMKCLRVSYKPKEKTNKHIFVMLELRGGKEGAANWWLENFSFSFWVSNFNTNCCYLNQHQLSDLQRAEDRWIQSVSSSALT